MRLTAVQTAFATIRFSPRPQKTQTKTVTNGELREPWGMRRAVLLLVFVAACSSDDPLAPEATNTGTGGNTGDAATETSSGTTAETGDSDGGSGSGDEGSSESGDPLPIPTGPELYASLCSGCHGLEGEGTELGYELRHPDRELSTYVIRTGREGVEFENSAMAAYGEDLFSDAQLVELYDWLDSFEQPADGAGLYADYCANCHGADPLAGGVIDKDIADKDLNDMREKVREGVGEVSDPRQGYMSSFSETQLSDAELQAMIDWM